MKTLLIYLLFISNFGISQTSGFFGTSLDSDNGQNLFVQIEDQSKWAKIQITYLTDFRLDEQKINLKLMVRPIRTNGFRVWVTVLPYVNMNLREGGKYNTPMNLEVNFKNHLIFGIDTNFKEVQFQIRFRQKVF